MEFLSKFLIVDCVFVLIFKLKVVDVLLHGNHVRLLIVSPRAALVVLLLFLPLVAEDQLTPFRFIQRVDIHAHLWREKLLLLR